jgi:GNAT superfamily N-acetyltransferase
MSDTFVVPAEASIRIETWTPDRPSVIESDIDSLAAVLNACVSGGASISFVLPFSHKKAETFWRDDVIPAVIDGKRRLLVARACGAIVGTVQLDLGTPPNQPHRAEVRKLLVHPDHRRQGIAAGLMAAVEAEAAAVQRTLLTLDTVTGGHAEVLYRSVGYLIAGVIPGYALNYNSTVLESTTLMYKSIAASPDVALDRCEEEPVRS